MEAFRSAVFIVNQVAFVVYMFKIWIPHKVIHKPVPYFLAMICSSTITLTNFGYIAMDIMSHTKPYNTAIDAIFTACWAAVAFYDWHNWKNNRKGKKKVLKALGDKSRQALAKLKQSMPRVVVPSPVPIPS